MTDALRLLQARFIERCQADLEQLERLGPEHPDLGTIAHRLAGAAGSFGYPEVSKAAAVVDDHARYGPEPASEDVQTLIQALEKAIATIPSPDRD